MKTVICADSFEWLPANRDQGSIVTSLPDASEIGIEDLNEYDKWVRRAATEIFLSASGGCPVIFIQTDRRKNGRQFSKANLLMDIAQELDWFLLWHKIELTAEVGKSSLYRPTYRNMLCFGRGKMSAGQATPDVVPKSKRLYDMAFGFEAAKVCVEFCLKFSNRVLDPFCGYGTVLHVAEELGMGSTGVDIAPACCEAAKISSTSESARIGGERHGGAMNKYHQRVGHHNEFIAEQCDNLAEGDKEVESAKGAAVE